MIIVLNSKTKFLATIIAFVLMLGFILWEYFHGGVLSHHFFHNEDMPRVSNWWGLLSIPIVTWLSLSIIQKNENKTHQEKTLSKFEIYGFIGGLLFGIALTILFFNESVLSNYLLLLTFVLALFLPLYKPEFYLGFIISMIYEFGGALPVVIGLLLIAVYAIEYFVIRKAFLIILSKIRHREE
jgi:hypothetical protein